MEFSPTWTCGCGAINTGDVFNDACWECGNGGAKVTIKTAEQANVCPTCKCEVPWHTLRCVADKCVICGEAAGIHCEHRPAVTPNLS